MNEIINTDKAINKIIDILEKADGNILLYDTLNNIKICLDYGAIQLLKAYYILTKIVFVDSMTNISLV